jgi:hypothetical protein
MFGYSQRRFEERGKEYQLLKQMRLAPCLRVDDGWYSIFRLKNPFEVDWKGILTEND